MSWLSKLQELKAEAASRNADPWRLPLERVQGKIDWDGIERVSSQTLLDILEVPQRSRRAGTYRHLAKIMVELGWTAVRVRDLTRGGYKEQVRGYCRDARAIPPYLIENVRLLAVPYQGNKVDRPQASFEAHLASLRPCDLATHGA
jgi:hypothetical protein